MFKNEFSKKCMFCGEFKFYYDCHTWEPGMLKNGFDTRFMCKCNKCADDGFIHFGDIYKARHSFAKNPFFDSKDFDNLSSPPL